jgi:hypothetical protein
MEALLLSKSVKISNWAPIFVALICCLCGCLGMTGDDRNLPAPLAECMENGLIFSEDFESENYKENWTVHWGSPVGAGVVENPSSNVYHGRRSAYLEVIKGTHNALGSGEYVPLKPIDDIAFMRVMLKLENSFSMGRSRTMKLFGIKGGATVENAYGGAGAKPTGKDKFSVRLTADNWGEVFIYYYHPDQIGPYGDTQYSRSFLGGPKLSPGKWYCLEMMLKLNTPGRRDGEIRAWVDDELAVSVNHLRLRDMASMKIRRFTLEAYFGGALASDTPPKDQRLYIDDFAVATCRIGCSKP